VSKSYQEIFTVRIANAVLITSVGTCVFLICSGVADVMIALGRLGAL